MDTPVNNQLIINNIPAKIEQLLNQHHCIYEVKHHPPTRTSEESAKYRNEPLKIGAKAIVLKADNHFIMAVLPANRHLNSNLLKKYLRSKNLRFATGEELFQLTSLVPGAVPPFGSLFNLRMIVDEALFSEEFMAFNAGSLEQSIKMKTQDYAQIIQPETLSFTT